MLYLFWLHSGLLYHTAGHPGQTIPQEVTIEFTSARRERKKNTKELQPHTPGPRSLPHF